MMAQAAAHAAIHVSNLGTMEPMSHSLGSLQHLHSLNHMHAAAAAMQPNLYVTSGNGQRNSQPQTHLQQGRQTVGSHLGSQMHGYSPRRAEMYSTSLSNSPRANHQVWPGNHWQPLPRVPVTPVKASQTSVDSNASAVNPDIDLMASKHEERESPEPGDPADYLPFFRWATMLFCRDILTFPRSLNLLFSRHVL